MRLVRRHAFVLAVLAAVRLAAHESTLHALLAPTLAQAPAQPAAADAAATVPLALEITVAPSAEPVAALVRITEVATGRAVGLPAHLRRPMGWHSLPARATVHVPPGELRIEAVRGLDTLVSTTTARVAASGATEPVRLALRRFHDPAARRLVGANTHLHLRLNAPRALGGADLRSRRDAEDYLTAIGGSDALDLVYVSHLERASEDAGYVSNGFTRDDLQRLSGARVRFVNGEEHRHEGGRVARRGGPDELRYGHVLFLDLPRLVRPASYGAIFAPAPVSDATPMRRAIDEARAQQAAIVWCHGRQGTEDVPNWIAGRLHAQNIFDGGNEGGFDAVFYPLLNAGLRVPFSTGTDWGCYDFSRVYVPLAGELSSRGFLDGLAAGRSFITNGPFLELEVEGRAVGDTLDLAAPRDVRVRARALGRDDFERVELIHNGNVIAAVATRAEAGHFAAALDTTLALREPGWLALRVTPSRPYNDRTEYTGAGANLFGKAVFAHTSPIYVTLGGRGIAQPEALDRLIADVEASVQTITSKGAFASDAERDRLLAIYREAAAALAARR